MINATKIYVTFDRGLKVFDQPFFSPVDKTDIKEAYRRQFFHNAKKAYENNLDWKDLYYLGTFDESKGEAVFNKEFLFDLREVLPEKPQEMAADLTPAQLVELLAQGVSGKIFETLKGGATNGGNAN